MKLKPQTKQKVSCSFHFVVLPLGFLLSFMAIHCAPQPKTLTPEERLEAVDNMYSEYQEGFPEVPEVEPAELAEALADGSTVLVDVREPREWAVSRIPGAITLDAFERAKDTYRDRPIVAYCTIGYRSGQFAQRLTQAGFDASNLRGSILAWVHAGQPLVNDEGETTQVHVYGPQWDLLPDGFESVW
ncbi:MAG: hypothetical protein DHS20C16_37340 [Phycisphaerae bacterium]|nr:MAG: hypothetical protein DHS20C16_37340 [Phycisphaerae bacterium]